MPAPRSQQVQHLRTDTVDPLLRVSPHFILADFLGCQSVYAKGLANMMADDEKADLKLDNLAALCNEALEPIVGAYGSLSVSYGYISPEVSRAIVKYQDPDKPSHHRFDLGAAADICVHSWVLGEAAAMDDLYLPETARGAPIALAHGIDIAGIPYSRLITYSESPYLCLAVAAEEVRRGSPRKAFYENRYQGHKGTKPEYTILSTQDARNKHFERLQERGLPFSWRGHGHPTYHGGGYRQLHHIRVSRYTMVSDWLLDLQSIAAGAKNIPDLGNEAVQDSFAAAGMVYDLMLGYFNQPHISIVGGYVSPSNPFFSPSNDWRTKEIRITLAMREEVDGLHMPEGAKVIDVDGELVTVEIGVDDVLNSDEWQAPDFAA